MGAAAAAALDWGTAAAAAGMAAAASGVAAAATTDQGQPAGATAGEAAHGYCRGGVRDFGILRRSRLKEIASLKGEASCLGKKK